MKRFERKKGNIKVEEKGRIKKKSHCICQIMVLGLSDWC